MANQFCYSSIKRWVMISSPASCFRCFKRKQQWRQELSFCCLFVLWSQPDTLKLNFGSHRPKFNPLWQTMKNPWIQRPKRSKDKLRKSTKGCLRRTKRHWSWKPIKTILPATNVSTKSWKSRRFLSPTKLGVTTLQRKCVVKRTSQFLNLALKNNAIPISRKSVGEPFFSFKAFWSLVFIFSFILGLTTKIWATLK